MRRSTRIGLGIASVTAIGVAVASIVWPGLDAQDTPPTDPAVWVLQSDGLRYGRVNTAVGELDTVRRVANPTRLVNAGADAYMFTDSDSKVVRIDEASPVDLDSQGLEDAVVAPDGVRETATAGDFIAYRADDGSVYTGRLSTGTTSRLDPYSAQEDDDAPQYAADAIAVDERGILFSYSAADGAVLRWDIAASEQRGRDPLVAEVATPILSAAVDDWVLIDATEGMYWTEGADEPAPTGVTGTPAVARASAEADAVYLSDETGMVRVPVDGSAAHSVFGDAATVQGTPARPVMTDGVVYGAWLPEGSGPGALWRSDRGRIDLDYGGLALPTQRRPVFAGSGQAMILNDTRSGWVWTAADGRLLPSSQDWTLDDPQEQRAVPSEEEQRVVIDPRPPVAVDDDFGVRPGRLVALPVLLNDHDPNTDVLTIDPESVTGLDPGFGVLTTTDDRQRLAVRVSADAVGTATFGYRVTDGTAEGGLTSAEATVSLHVAADDVNSAPQWCVSDCRQVWPTPTVARGGTVTIPVLSNWVDPEGDAMLLLSADGAASGSVAATPTGDVVFQHSDDGTGADETVHLQVGVADARGEVSTRGLDIRVVAEPQPRLQSFAVVDAVGSRVTVDVAAHVTGSAGDTTVTEARVLDDAPATATVVAGTTRFDFSAADPGVYRVAVTIAVAGREASGTARITLLPADAPAQLSTAPVVAFVRPQFDATVDVFAAVSNPTRRVLLLSDVLAAPAPGATLSVDAVAQSQVRVSGTTADGQPGLLGTVGYRVSDGTNDDGAVVEGQATVYLLPPAPETAPIAVDDTAVVRAGAQVDIPVVNNDISAAGTRPRIAPDTVQSSTTSALAFASGDVLRYLAPTQPGQYTVDYAVFTPGAPGLRDTATVRIQVTSDEANRPPLPGRLSGRVLSGLSTTIAFDGFGMDPDGDGVRLDAIVTQPETGSASISPDGMSLVYTSVAGDRGQREFTYRVVDAMGAVGEAVARVGVLDSDANPSPVTYTDYVHVHTGSEIRVSPLANDLDPTQGSLTLDAVVPDIPETTLDGAASDEYARLADLVASVQGGTVTITAGAEPTTMSFLYDVTSSSGNTARGLIVVRVVSERVPDYPVVADTVLTVEDRDEFTTGVDVLAGKVQWGGGDVDQLRLGLWGAPRGVDVRGDTLRGELTDSTRLIPFSVTGTVDDDQVTTFAFLRVPAAAELTLALRRGSAPVQVAEGDEVTFDLADLVALPPRERLEVGEAVAASGARAEARCERGTGTTVRYLAGNGAPWSDACLVPVRRQGTSEWTLVSVPIAVIAGSPQPVLIPAALTIAPGDRLRYDLTDMTQWQGRAQWDALEYAIDGQTHVFDVEFDGAALVITAADDAMPGTEEAVTVEVTSHPGVAPARINLRVGAVPSTFPQGGSVATQCTQALGSSCTVEVIGAPGEVNPLPRTPLVAVAVRPLTACEGVSFTLASATQVEASWTADAPGGRCSATVAVRDAQGRVSAPDRGATVTVDLQGFPAAPAAIVQSGYADGALTLQIDAGAAARSTPALIGFDVRFEGTSVATCTAAGICPSVAAPNGEPRVYEALALNAVGASRASVSTTAWAYDPPTPPTSVTASPVVTAGDGGMVALTIAGVHAAATSALQISSPAGETRVVPIAEGQTAVTVPAYRVGANTATTVTVTPQSRFTVPPVAAAAPTIESATVSAHGIGRPLDVMLKLTATSVGDGRVDVEAVVSATAGGDGAGLRFGIVRDGQSCSATGSSSTRTFSGLPDGRLYAFVACVDSVFAGDVYGTAGARAEVRAVQSTQPPRGYEFIVGPTPHVEGQRANWTVDQTPRSSESVPFDNSVVFRGYPSGVFDTDPGIEVRYEHNEGWWVSDWGTVRPAPGSAPSQVQAQWWVEPCVTGAELKRRASSTDGRATVSFSADELVYYDADGEVLPAGDDPWQVPEDAVRASGIAVRVEWSRDDWNLEPATAQFSAACTPAAG